MTRPCYGESSSTMIFLRQAGLVGNVQSELLFQKNPLEFTFEKGWAFPRRIYFNGDNCVMPPPDSYPWLPNASPKLQPHHLSYFSSLSFLF
ncbi:hypothetical protein AXX17_AT2G06650 [Arabidopsis thaliana]|uniref:COBRA C-terminal domain-containing protein n=1 Tax=Arabidopsis thaliana TaxID=3702 RepID=A0A178W0Q5_ARATH|nr:hypothetical protein AXX17_AT2G06650 [Arabidopsis thaliana]